MNINCPNWQKKVLLSQVEKSGLENNFDIFYILFSPTENDQNYIYYILYTIATSQKSERW